MNIRVPYNFEPRDYQLNMLSAFDEGFKRIFCLWHRRAGKDLTLWNLMIREAVKNPGLYYYMLPTYTQAKKILWEGMTNDGRTFLDYIPRELVTTFNSTELRVEMFNGSIIRLVGTDRFDSIRGTNPVGVVFSEYAYQNPMAWEVVSPILKANGGWAIFNTTPNGENHSWELHQMAINNPLWYAETLTVKDTGVLTEQDIEEERASGKSEEYIQQEYYCRYDIAMDNKIYADLMIRAEEENRVTSVPYDALYPVQVFFDLGKNDATSIIFTQIVGKETRIIDFYENTGKEIADYVNMLRDKPYRYSFLGIPHDGFSSRLESAKTIAAQFEEAGFEVKKIPAISHVNGVASVRGAFKYFWFDKEKTTQLRRAIKHYQYTYDPVKKINSKYPLHDWSSHANDALKYMVAGIEESTSADNYDILVQDYLKPKKPDLGLKPAEYAAQQREYQAAVNQYLR